MYRQYKFADKSDKIFYLINLLISHAIVRLRDPNNPNVMNLYFYHGFREIGSFIKNMFSRSRKKKFKNNTSIILSLVVTIAYVELYPNNFHFNIFMPRIIDARLSHTITLRSNIVVIGLPIHVAVFDALCNVQKRTVL